MASKVVEAFTFDGLKKQLKVLDQTLLPSRIEYVEVPGVEDGHAVIKSMKVRGAPCIAAVGCLSLAADLNLNLDKLAEKSAEDIIELIRVKSDYLITSRPTAVNLRKALGMLVKYCENQRETCKTGSDLVDKVTNLCESAIKDGLELNKRLGNFGAKEIIRKCGKSSSIKILTHCNTGGLATVGYGTALGVIRSLHKLGALERAFCTETRPYNQGSRLTAWELVTEEIPATLIADSMVAYLMATEKIDAVVVGADCVSANGDTANKIGTMQIAILAKHFDIPFYVAAPTQSIDVRVKGASDIEIEQRPANELRRIGDIDLAPKDVDVWNPCFDVTPDELIAGIITEHGVCLTEKITGFVTLTTALDMDKKVHLIF